MVNRGWYHSSHRFWGSSSSGQGGDEFRVLSAHEWLSSNESRCSFMDSWRRGQVALQEGAGQRACRLLTLTPPQIPTPHLGKGPDLPERQSPHLEHEGDPQSPLTCVVGIKQDDRPHVGEGWGFPLPPPAQRPLPEKPGSGPRQGGR